MYDRVRRILSKQMEIDLERITLDTDIVEDLGADSLDVVELIMTIEKECGLVITDEGVSELRTVRDIAEFVENLT
jgi:acyl carrier protein